MHKEVVKIYTEKYKKYIINISKSENSQEVTLVKGEINTSVDVVVSLDEIEIFKELKVYRLRKSREESIKPYFIYNDNQLKDLITKMPRNKEELKTVSGFGEVKTNKYSDDILPIIRKY